VDEGNTGVNLVIKFEDGNGHELYSATIRNNLKDEWVDMKVVGEAPADTARVVAKACSNAPTRVSRALMRASFSGDCWT